MKQRTRRTLLTLLLALTLCLTLAAPALAADPVVYSGDTLFPGRTKAEIAQHYKAVFPDGCTYDPTNEESWYSAAPSLEAPYRAGRLTDDTHKVMTAFTNYFRWLVGVEPLKTVSQHSDDMQKAALVRNWEFNHRISPSSKPDDMDQALWDQGAGVWHNILAYNYTPHGAIWGWVNEGYSLDSQSWDTIGHRYALISSDVSDLQFGYAGSVAIGVYNDRSNTMPRPFAAFPTPGDMPLEHIDARSSVWTVELNPAILTCTDESSVAVTVTRVSGGEQYVCTEANGKLHAGSTMSFVQPEPADEGYDYADGEQYRVEIIGLTEAATGNPAKLDYTVRFFALSKVLDGSAPEQPDSTPAPGTPFTDVPVSEYFYEPVKWAVQHDPQITDGTSDTTFSPYDTCTRGQVVTFLWRANGCPEPKSTKNPFKDVKSGDYFYKAILWAVEKGITDGTTDTAFSPEDPCTRAHVVTFLWRANEKPDGGSKDPFKDVPAGEYYNKAVLWAVAQKITDGTTDTTFSPDDPCTRGQIVTFLYRAEK